MSDSEPTVDALTGAKSLPMKEKLKILDQEIYKLHKACTDAGYKPEKIKEVASPLLKTARRGQIKRTSRICVYLVIVSCIIAGLYKMESTNFAMKVAYKKLMVYWVLPYYDWTWLFTSECLMENPYFDPPEEGLTEDNCTICQNVTEIVRLTNVDSDDMTEMIYGLMPAIITDAMADWRAITENATLDTFIKLYATDERTMNSSGERQTNHFRVTKGLPKTITNATALAKWVYEEDMAGNKPNFTAQWSNINTGSYKALHYYYRKPYFLPNMCEALRSLSYITVARQNETNKLKGLILRPRSGDMGIWVGQVEGKNEVILNPEKMCEKICPKVRFVLNQGEILNVPLGLYQITYRPNSTETVGIAVGYEFQ